MTDYGRGAGSEPWHPEDPLFGDGYDQAQQPYPPQQQVQYPQAEYDPYATGQHQQQYPQQQGGQQYPQTPQQYEQQGYPQQQPQHPQGQYQPQQHPQQHPQQQQYPQAQYDGYDTGSHSVGGYGHQDPYGGHQPQDPYAGGPQPDFYGQNGYPPPQQPQYRQQPQAPFQGQGPGQGPGGPGQGGLSQGAPGQGQPQAPLHGQGQPQGQGPAQGTQGVQGAQDGHPQEPGARPLRTAPGNTGDWDAGEDDDPREHAFFSGRDDDDDDAPATTTTSGGGRRAGKSAPAKGGKKRRSGCACLVVLVVLGGGLGGVGYFGYNFYQDRFGPAPDYSGNGAGEVQVEIPKGSTITTMGNILKSDGVVKSVDAFTAAARKNPKGQFIQAGVYVLNKQMSAASAVTMMLDPKSQNAMIIAEGMRDAQIYDAIDKRLGLSAGSTKKVAHDQAKNLGLPDWADTSSKVKDPLEGFLFPSRYGVAKGMKPEALLREMVGEAKKQYAQFDMVAEAKKQNLSSPLQLLTVASLVQAEGKTDDDFRKMAKVVYNRMVPTNKETFGLLQFDSTYNYIKNTSATNISLAKIKSLDDPYNTYKYKGLPPGPIGNPGVDALKAAMNPDSGNWYYFISLDGKTTKFTSTHAEFQKLYDQYNSQ
ncbi:endolytic transglycosylase MltG [Streptomyces sp. NPDC088197]|uniref:endolytic transglycosylase MltG n=1 Tax=Streptomyces sp. NPDC088197 TaxID=3365840 RepID=UPI0037F79123